VLVDSLQKQEGWEARALECVGAPLAHRGRGGERSEAGEGLRGTEFSSSVVIPNLRGGPRPRAVSTCFPSQRQAGCKRSRI